MASGLEPRTRRALLDRYRVTRGKGFRLADHDPDNRGDGLVEHEQAEALLADGVRRLSALQSLLYADGRWAMLALFQAMDAGGKDGTIRHVMSGVNPQGVDVTAFKQPGPVELTHDFLWRIHQAVPARGRIGIHNRSHYEELLVTRVHPEILAHQHLPEARLEGGERFWKRRMRDIRHFERYLDRQGIPTLKFFLHISKDEQRTRFLARLDDADKTWKFSTADLAERQRWDAYQAAYEAAIIGTARPHAPWFVVPGDHKWFARLVVVEALIEQLEAFALHAPHSDKDARAGLEDARRSLEAEG